VGKSMLANEMHDLFLFLFFDPLPLLLISSKPSLTLSKSTVVIAILDLFLCRSYEPRPFFILSSN
jgi:hypothetical protein